MQWTCGYECPFWRPSGLPKNEDSYDGLCVCDRETNSQLGPEHVDSGQPCMWPLNDMQNSYKQLGQDIAELTIEREQFAVVIAARCKAKENEADYETGVALVSEAEPVCKVCANFVSKVSTPNGLCWDCLSCGRSYDFNETLPLAPWKPDSKETCK